MGQMAAQAALELDGKQVASDFNLKVVISDPSAKTARTDAKNSTLFVGGLAPRTTEGELQSLFERVSIQ